MERRSGRTVVGGVATALALGVSGCGEPVVDESSTGVNEDTGALALRNVHIQAPGSAGPYRPGDDARAFLTVHNDSSQPRQLTSVTSPDVRRVEIRWDRSCDGTAEVVSALPIPPEGAQPTRRDPGLPTRRAYHLRLVDFEREVLQNTTVPLTFAFDGGERVTVEARVVPTAANQVEPFGSCPPTTPTTTGSPT